MSGVRASDAVAAAALHHPRPSPLARMGGGRSACAVLCCAVLCCAVLCCAVLCGAVLGTQYYTARSKIQSINRAGSPTQCKHEVPVFPRPVGSFSSSFRLAYYSGLKAPKAPPIRATFI